MRRLILLMIIASAAGSAQAQPHLQAPSQALLMQFYPRQALKGDVDGKVAMSCIAARGEAWSCSVLNEFPRDYGFGRAALAMAAVLKVSGEGRFSTNIRFSTH